MTCTQARDTGLSATNTDPASRTPASVWHSLHSFRLRGGGLTSLTLPTYRCLGGILVTVMADSVQHSINKRLLTGTVTDQSLGWSPRESNGPGLRP